MSTVVASSMFLLSALSFAQTQTPSTATNPAVAPSSPAAASAANANAISLVLLLPLEQPLLRRAAAAVRDGAQAALRATGARVALRECAYGTDAVVAAYQRCVNERVDVVIGPLGRADVSALLEAKLPLVKPTLLLSPSGRNPPEPFIVLAPDLESEADAIARQSLNDACRKPMLVEGSGAIANRVATSITTYFRLENPATQLSHFELSSRDRWARITDGWRRDGVDCVLFAGSSASLFEFRPYLRDIAVYITSASYDAELDRTADWSGVRIADSTLLLDPTRAEFANLSVAESMSPTLVRLFALGVDAVRIAANSVEIVPSNAATPAAETRVASTTEFRPLTRVDGAIGQLQLRSGAYVRTPSIGEFRGRTPTWIGP
jgi:outer membrane PBP1 activator LpoA protein